MASQDKSLARAAVPAPLSLWRIDLCPRLLVLGLALGGCGLLTPDSEQPASFDESRPGPSLAGPLSGPRSMRSAVTRERDLAELGRRPVDVVLTDQELLSRYIVEVSQDVDPAVVARQNGAQTLFIFTAALRGFSAYLNPEQIEKLRSSAHVLNIESVRRVRASAVQLIGADGQPWGLDRISQDALPLNGQYSYDHNGSGIRAYVIDTGLYRYHDEFENRALRMFDAFGGDGDDLHGHGTHVAGTIGGVTYGVAKRVQLRGIRVLDRTGNGSTDGVIAGVDWVAAHGDKPAVVNMSLGGGDSEMLKRAVNNLAAAGFFTAVAAGNDGVDACTQSPANASGAFAVGASGKNDRQTDFSNYGRCVSLYAPGESIRSAWIGDRLNTISGTSMASPHVAGTAALYKQAHGDTDSVSLKSWLQSQATHDVLRDLGRGSPNLLLFQPL